MYVSSWGFSRLSGLRKRFDVLATGISSMLIGDKVPTDATLERREEVEHTSRHCSKSNLVRWNSTWTPPTIPATEHSKHSKEIRILTTWIQPTDTSYLWNSEEEALRCKAQFCLSADTWVARRGFPRSTQRMAGTATGPWRGKLALSAPSTSKGINWRWRGRRLRRQCNWRGEGEEMNGGDDNNNTQN